ncbi:MAG TPA: lysophospholipid acyltransferase family protein [Syntrophales bacterium]|nr:lysophospholipid acyltransferase family protein [Syntrophales bacterium]HPN08116.1 lysophospholipid acyltransferase family protein [Syntrophales bacterium]HPX80825.1 lysophospholipid acyltransferase family protein [Syntrophales bacterium]
MVDLEYLKRINLVSIPRMQQFLGTFMLGPNYNIFQKVDIVLENIENIPPGENVIFAMNHTDRFNYWPFQYKLWRLKRYNWTTVWVKGKYYRNKWLGKGLDSCNLIPVPSLGYLIEEFYTQKYARRIDRDLYRRVRDAIDGKDEGTEVHAANIAETNRLFGGDFIVFIRDFYERIMAKVADLTRIALFERGLSLIIFPEGTRGTQLGEGKTGIAQVALHTGKTVVPVGCNNSDQVYPDSLPFARTGRIVYRVGKPLSIADRLRPFRIEEPFQLLSRSSQQQYKEQFEGATNVIMESINELLDENYRR